MSKLSLAAVVLCAGKGTRMHSDKAKVLHPLLGRPLCFYPIDRALELGARPVVAVVGHQASEVEKTVGAAFSGRGLTFALQAEQRGTGHAVQCALGALGSFEGAVLILYGDVPLLRRPTLERLVEAYLSAQAPLALITTTPESPKGYGRIIRNNGQVVGVVEEKDATEEQRAIRETNAGIYLAEAGFLRKAVAGLSSANAQKEYYLTDIISLAAKQGGVAAVSAEAHETAGVNDLVELSERTRLLRERINKEHQLRGVSLLHPESTFIEEGVEIGPDCVLGPMVCLQAGSKLGAGVRVGQGCVVVASTVADQAELRPYSVLEEAVVGPRCVIGPFARLRPGTELAAEVHLGNFVETKKTRIAQGSKANHLSYLGDAEIGAGVNVGAGTITCNYDGVQKHKTVLGDGVFIGSDTQLVAPVTVGAGAYVAAGSTVTQDVPQKALAISRVPQVNKEGWVDRKAPRRDKG